MPNKEKKLFQYSQALVGKLTNTLFTFTYVGGANIMRYNLTIDNAANCVIETEDGESGKQEYNSHEPPLKLWANNGTLYLAQQLAATELRLFNMADKLVWQTPIANSNELPIPGHLPNGLYWYSVHTATNTVETGKIILQ